MKNVHEKYETLKRNFIALRNKIISGQLNDLNKKLAEKELEVTQDGIKELFAEGNEKIKMMIKLIHSNRNIFQMEKDRIIFLERELIYGKSEEEIEDIKEQVKEELANLKGREMMVLDILEDRLKTMMYKCSLRYGPFGTKSKQ